MHFGMSIFNDYCQNLIVIVRIIPILRPSMFIEESYTSFDFDVTPDWPEQS